MDKAFKILVSPVAFNEHVKLKNVIERLLKSPMAQQADFCVIDDGSTDSTTDMIRGYADRGVKTIKHPARQGVGAAIRTAIKHGRKEGYDILVIMAGNDKDNPDEIPRLTGPIINDGFDFIQGSRYQQKDGIGGDMPGYRKVATRVHPFLMSMFAGKKVTDSTNGFRALRLSLFDDARINIDQPWLDKYELEPYLLFKTLTLGYKFKEAGVTKIYPSKKLGYTKMKPFIGWWSILRPVFLLGLGIKK